MFKMCGHPISQCGLCIDQLENHLQHHAQDAPEHTGQKVYVLLYADDIVLLSRFLAGLQHLLHVLQLFCGDKLRSVHMSKTQVFIFNNFQRSHSDSFWYGGQAWRIGDYYHIWELFCTKQIFSKQRLRSLPLQASTLFLRCSIAAQSSV